MAKFGGYRKIGYTDSHGNPQVRYYDTIAKRFISTAEGQALDRVARAYGSLSRGLNAGLLAAAESISQRYGVDYDTVVERLDGWRRDVAAAIAAGDEVPAIPSP